MDVFLNRRKEGDDSLTLRQGLGKIDIEKIFFLNFWAVLIT